jgi:TPR repeat protein
MPQDWPNPNKIGKPLSTYAALVAICVLFATSSIAIAGTVADECDRLARYPQDQSPPREVAGVVLEKINVNKAEPICRAALNADPMSPRLLFELARVMVAKKEFDEAERLLRRAIGLGHVLSMNSLGSLYDNGEGRPVNYAIAREWYERGAVAGCVICMRMMGISSELGRGVSIDKAAAIIWYEKAAALDDAVAARKLGVLYVNERNYILAKQYYEKAAGLGDFYAAVDLAGLYYNGLGVAYDYQVAKLWYEEAISLSADVPSEKSDEVKDRLDKTSRLIAQRNEDALRITGPTKDEAIKAIGDIYANQSSKRLVGRNKNDQFESETQYEAGSFRVMAADNSIEFRWVQTSTFFPGAGSSSKQSEPSLWQVSFNPADIDHYEFRINDYFQFELLLVAVCRDNAKCIYSNRFGNRETSEEIVFCKTPASSRERIAKALTYAAPFYQPSKRSSF